MIKLPRYLLISNWPLEIETNPVLTRTIFSFRLELVGFGCKNLMNLIDASLLAVSAVTFIPVEYFI